MEWFEEWFSSPYYHKLYKQRDRSEAALFIQKLVENQRWPEDKKILDLGCGNGRHAICLNEMGYNVVGLDLSSLQIQEAKKNENATLKFQLEDMRKLDYVREFDIVLNLFTSFGYFKVPSENRLVLYGVKKALRPNGVVVIDYMNSPKVVSSLSATEMKKIDGIEFEIKRLVKQGCIRKIILINDKEKGEEYRFEESVQILNLDDFAELLDEVNMEIFQVWGDYSGAEYNPKSSERMIIFAKN
jgi:SAM-dependent methyltransferase